MKQNNKGRREELTRLKFLKRLRNYTKGQKISANMTDAPLSVSNKHNMRALKTTGKPCSCYMCSPYKYNRAKTKREGKEND